MPHLSSLLLYLSHNIVKYFSKYFSEYNQTQKKKIIFIWKHFSIENILQQKKQILEQKIVRSVAKSRLGHMLITWLSSSFTLNILFLNILKCNSHFLFFFFCHIVLKVLLFGDTKHHQMPHGLWVTPTHRHFGVR